MARRIAIEEPCETCHGDPHKIDRWTCPDCVEGFQRRVLDPGSYVLIEKVDGEWRGIDWETAASIVEAVVVGAKKHRTIVTRKVAGHWAGRIIGKAVLGDALAGGEQLSIRERAERRGIADRISDQSGYNWPPPAVDGAGGEQP